MEQRKKGRRKLKVVRDSCCVSEVDLGSCTCPVEGIIDVVSKKWSLLIVTLLGNYGKLRHGDLKSKLTAISPKSLSDRLKELESAEVIKREVFPEVPIRVEYSLTKRGEELRNAVQPLIEWSSRKTSAGK
ncbi:MAG: helix-turn-helix transcriptional regulator [Thaumarchaeota archaeon]|nr:helix-turn-helix transcriptional regulator [Nitrososphaerota archaeon]